MTTTFLAGKVEVRGQPHKYHLLIAQRHFQVHNGLHDPHNSFSQEFQDQSFSAPFRGRSFIGIGVCLHMFINDESHGIAHIYGSPVRLESPL